MLSKRCLSVVMVLALAQSQVLICGDLDEKSPAAVENAAFSQELSENPTEAGGRKTEVTVHPQNGGSFNTDSKFLETSIGLAIVAGTLIYMYRNWGLTTFT